VRRSCASFVPASNFGEAIPHERLGTGMRQRASVPAILRTTCRSGRSARAPRAGRVSCWTKSWPTWSPDPSTTTRHGIPTAIAPALTTPSGRASLYNAFEARPAPLTQAGVVGGRRPEQAAICALSGHEGRSGVRDALRRGSASMAAERLRGGGNSRMGVGSDVRRAAIYFVHPERADRYCSCSTQNDVPVITRLL